MREWIQGSAGALLFAAALALSLPGVSVSADPASADAAPASPSPDAGMCRADAPLAQPGVIHGVTEALRRQALAAPDESVRALNVRGYNYQKNRQVDLGALELEIRMGRDRTH